jgi:hypothetical protein
MIMPGTGDRWFIGIQKLLQFFPWFIYFVVFTALTKNLVTKKETLHEESKHFHY